MNNKVSKIKSILVIDSGIGGLSTLAEVTTLTKANFIYFADNNNSPYGDKSNEFLKNRLYGIINSLQIKFNFSMVILACNTATTSAIEFLRNKFPNLSFIGTEPAYKLAINKNFKSPVILATPRTITNLSKKIENNFKLIQNRVLANLIEQTFTSHSFFSNFLLLKEIFKLKTTLKNNDCLVLGCTHYVFIKDKLSKILNISIIDGNNGVARRVFNLCKHLDRKKLAIKIILSQQNSISLQKYKKILKQILANQIKLC